MDRHRSPTRPGEAGDDRMIIISRVILGAIEIAGLWLLWVVIRGL